MSYMDVRERDQPGRAGTVDDNMAGSASGTGATSSVPASYGDGGQAGWYPRVKTMQQGSNGNGGLPGNYESDVQYNFGQSYTRQTFPAPSPVSLPLQTFPSYPQYARPLHPGPGPGSGSGSGSYDARSPTVFPKPPGLHQSHSGASRQPASFLDGLSLTQAQTFPPQAPPQIERNRKYGSGDGTRTDQASMVEAAEALNGLGAEYEGGTSAYGARAGVNGNGSGASLGRIRSNADHGSNGFAGLPPMMDPMGPDISSRRPGPGSGYEPLANVSALGSGDGQPTISPHGNSNTGSPKTRQEPPPAKKRKRKNGKEVSGATAADDGDDSRRKTSRACDICRSKKIRCDIIIFPHSAGPDGERHPQGLCTHCRNANLECTFFLPITETRFKKRRGDQDPIATKTSSPEAMSEAQPPEKVEKAIPQRKRSEAFAPFVHASEGPPTSVNARSPMDAFIPSPSVGAVSSGSKTRDTIPTGRMEGPTSIAFLLHTASAIPRNIVESYDLKHHTTWHITSDDGDGIIHVSNPPPSGSFGNHGDSPAGGESNHRRESGDGKPILTAEIISSLVNDYFDYINPLFPIVSKGEFCAEPNPPPLLLYAMAGVAASRRGTPKRVFDGIRTIINGIIRNNDVLSDATFFNVQALLICAMVGDLHAQPVTTAVSAGVTRIGAAIRMAQNVGLHRENGAVPETAGDMAKIELKRRVWAGCVILDRWCSATLGIPCVIDLHDVDVLVPSPYDVIKGSSPVAWQAAEVPPYAVIVEQLKLAILLGRVSKAIYSPLGINATSDDQLRTLMADMDAWETSLPKYLTFTDRHSSQAAGLLYLGSIAVQFLFWRPFMRMSYTVPGHITFAMSIKQWTHLTDKAKRSITWLNTKETVLDTIFIFAYSATNCALVLYHHWIRRNDIEGLTSLELLRDVVSRWEMAVQPDHMSIRRKTIEVMSLLYEAAKKRPQTLMVDPAHDATHSLPGHMNPTAGVGRRSASAFRNFFWQNHPERPGEGIFIAKALAEGLDGIPESLMIRAPEARSRSGSTSQGGIASLEPVRLGEDDGLLRTGNVQGGPILGQERVPLASSGPLDSSTTASFNDSFSSGGLSALGQYGSSMLGAGGRGVPNESLTIVPPARNINLNPALSGYGAMFAEQPPTSNSDMAHFMNMLDQTADPNAAAEAAAMDQTMLASLPLASYDWSGWEQYFDGLNVTAGTEQYPFGSASAEGQFPHAPSSGRG